MRVHLGNVRRAEALNLLNRLRGNCYKSRMPMAKPAPQAPMLLALVQATDSELISGLVAGDERALELFHTRYQELVHRTALRIVGDEGSAEEVTQDVFTAAWGARGRLDPRQLSFRPWLLTTTRHKSIDWLRRRGNASSDELDENISSRSAVDGGSGQACQNMVTGRLAGAVSKLPPSQAEVIRLVYWHGCSGPQAARIIGVPLSTVKGRLRLAIGGMTELLRSQPGSLVTALRPGSEERAAGHLHTAFIRGVILPRLLPQTR